MPMNPMDLPIEDSEAAMLERLVRPRAGGWSRAASEAILSLTFDQRDVVEMTRLLEKSKNEDLSDAEAYKLENYRHLGKLLELLQSRARCSLQTSSDSLGF